MKKILRHNPKELARQTPVAEITDAQVWQYMITPVVKALLGPVIESKIELLDTSANIIPEDKIYNINGHVIAGCNKRARFPYYHSLYICKKGVIIIRRDGVKVEVLGWYGSLKNKVGQLIWKVALRDRRYDGTTATNDCPLEHFPYDDPKLNGNFFPGSKTVEIYLFSYSPGSSVVHASGDTELESFIAQPFAYADRPELFLNLYERAWRSNRAPGQWSEPIHDAGELMEDNFTKLAKIMGYDIEEVAASHYHVAMWCLHTNYTFTDPVLEQNFTNLRNGIEALKASGTKLTRRQESWVTVLQCLPKEYIPEQFYLNGARWPQDNITLPNLWLWKPLNEKAKSVKPVLVQD